MDVSKKQEAEKLIEIVRNEGNKILATLDGLEDEINELGSKGNELKRGDLAVDDLEQKFKKHLATWKENQKKFEEAKK